jgi:GTPase SAR1 family protein
MAESKEEEYPDPDVKVILLGDSAVGKSKLVERYLMDEYNPRQVTDDSSISAFVYNIGRFFRSAKMKTSPLFHSKLFSKILLVALNVRADTISQRC